MRKKSIKIYIWEDLIKSTAENNNDEILTTDATKLNSYLQCINNYCRRKLTPKPNESKVTCTNNLQKLNSPKTFETSSMFRITDDVSNNQDIVAALSNILFSIKNFLRRHEDYLENAILDLQNYDFTTNWKEFVTSTVKH